MLALEMTESTCIRQGKPISVDLAFQECEARSEQAMIDNKY
jgi:hypothetical protein